MAMEIWSLPTCLVGRHIRVFDEIDSTNSRALEMATPENDGLVLLAKSQSAGRGQHGRTWLAPPESSVLLSAVVCPPPELARPALLTAWAAVSVCNLIHRLSGQQARIKWPIDVFIVGKKVCGILIEQRNQNGRAIVVAGIGLNVTQPAEFFVEAGLPFGGSLATQTGASWLWRDVAEGLVGELDVQYARLLEGQTSALETAWRERLGLLGQRVQVVTAGGAAQGVLAHVSFAGIALTKSDGTTHRWPPESVRNVTLECGDSAPL